MVTDTTEDYANRNEKLADDTRQKWIATLAIGNGAALFAVFSLAFKEGQFIYPGPSLFAGWTFLFGVVVASIAQVSASAEMRFHELYWRTLANQETCIRGGAVEKAKGLQSMIDTHDRKGDEAGYISGWSALFSGIAFIVGVAVPLGAITRAYLAG